MTSFFPGDRKDLEETSRSESGRFTSSVEEFLLKSTLIYFLLLGHYDQLGRWELNPHGTN